MSYIYALYFKKQKAVKIGKADDLTTRLSSLVATWGRIDETKARAMSIDDVFVLKYEKELHKKFGKYKKDMPDGDGSKEFFETAVWNELDHDTFLPISGSVLRKVNKIKQKNNKLNKTTLSLSLTTKQKETISQLYQDDYDAIKKRLLLAFTKKDEDMFNLVTEAMRDEKIAQMESEIKELNRQLIIARTTRDEQKKCREAMKRYSDNVTARLHGEYELKQQIRILQEQLEYANVPDNVDTMVENEKLRKHNQELKQKISWLSGDIHSLKSQRYELRQKVKTIKRLSKRTLTQLNRAKKQPKIVALLNDEINQWIKDVEYL